MKKTYVDDDRKIMVDICLAHHGIWFDKGELQSLVKELAGKSPAEGATPGLLSFISDMFKFHRE
jgi:Zn-finger nucleic acid-binding protein